MRPLARTFAHARLAVALLAALSSLAPGSAEARFIPSLSGPVVDEAGLLDGGARRRLEGLCRAAWEQPADRRVQLQYLIVRSLEGEALEEFSMRVAESWRLGTRGKDNGVLLLVAVQDRRVRIEVGGGIEGGLTDAQSGRIIRSTIQPAFREQRYGEGLYSAGAQVLSALGALPAAGVERAPASRRGHVPGSPLLTLAFLALVAITVVGGLVSSVFGRRGFRGRGPWGGGPWIGGGWGGGSGGSRGGSGGGWSGGGGGFSGGGASGSW